jgi:hypothetical protein
MIKNILTIIWVNKPCVKINELFIKKEPRLNCKVMKRIKEKRIKTKK